MIKKILDLFLFCFVKVVGPVEKMSRNFFKKIYSVEDGESYEIMLGRQNFIRGTFYEFLCFFITKEKKINNDKENFFY